MQCGLLTIDFRGKIGLGQMHQVAYVNGATNVLAPSFVRVRTALADLPRG